MENVKDNQIILPGESFKVESGNLKISPNFTLNSEKKCITSNQMGILLIASKKKSTFIGIKNFPSKYFPEKEDHVIGRITNKNAEFYTLEIGGPIEAILGITDFEGASKRNRPFLEVGCLVYARVLNVNQYTKTQLTCTSTTNKKDWTSGEAMFGELIQGMILDVPIAASKELISDSKDLLKNLQNYVNFEISIGHNGRVWVTSNSTKHTMIILNIIKKSIDMDKERISILIKQVASHFSAQRGSA